MATEQELYENKSKKKAKEKIAKKDSKKTRKATKSDKKSSHKLNKEKMKADKAAYKEKIKAAKSKEEKNSLKKIRKEEVVQSKSARKAQKVSEKAKRRTDKEKAENKAKEAEEQADRAREALKSKQDALSKGHLKPEDVNQNIIPEGYNYAQINQYDPQQQELHKRSFEHTGPDSFLSRLAKGDKSSFDEMEAPALRQFNDLQGNLAGRFSQAGALNSSGFKNAATAASSNFAQDLASRRHELQRQAIGDLDSLSQSLLARRPVEKVLAQKPGEHSRNTGINGAIGAAGGAITGLAASGGNPAVGFQGAIAGHQVGSGF